MFAYQQVEVCIIGHAVTLVGRVHDLAHPGPVEPAPHIGGHVRKQEIVFDRVPDRAFGEGKARPRLLDGGVLVDQVAKGGIEGFMCHGIILKPGTSRAAVPIG